MSKENRITSLELHGVGVFKELRLDFQEKQIEGKAEVHIFTGVNGSGKTTLLEAMTLFDHWYIHNRIRENELWRSVLVGDIYPGRRKLSVDVPKDTLESNHVQLKIGATPIMYGLGMHDLNPSVFLNGPRKILNYFDSWGSGSESGSNPLFIAYFHSTEYTPATSQLAKVEFNPGLDALMPNKFQAQRTLFDLASKVILRNILAGNADGKKNTPEYEDTIAIIKRVFRDINGREINVHLDKDSAELVFILDGEPVTYDQLAEGYKSLLGWLMDLLFRLNAFKVDHTYPFTLFLDEIDRDLHPSAQRKILPVLQHIFPNAQIFITTHSPFVIGSVDGAWVYKLKLDKQGNSVLDGQPVLSEDGWSYMRVLADIFDINQPFGIAVEALFSEFHALRDKVLAGGNGTDKAALLAKARELADQGRELDVIIGHELRQLSRLKQEEFTL